MSELSISARKSAREKAARLTGRKDERVDASDYHVPGEMMADIKTGMRPISKRQFACGGPAAHHHAGRRTRKSGGALECADAKANLDMKQANRERDGEKHIGGMKKGGRAKRAAGGQAPPPSINVPTSGIYGAGFGSSKPGLLDQIAPYAKRGGTIKRASGGHVMMAGSGSAEGRLEKEQEEAHKRKAKAGGGECAEVSGTRPTGGRIARKDGGKAGKGKMNVNIIIGERSPPPAPPMGAAPPMGPPPPPPRPPGSMGGPPPMPPPGMPPMGPGSAPPMMPPMPPPRAAGGRMGRV